MERTEKIAEALRKKQMTDDEDSGSKSSSKRMDSDDSNVKEPKKESTTARSSRDIAMAAAVLNKGRGVKTSDKFVGIAKDMVAKMDDEELRILIENCKRFPLKKERFESAYKDDIAKSDETLKKFMSSEDIENTGPRKDIRRRYVEFKEVCEKFIWKKESNMNWGAIVQVPDVEKILKHTKMQNRTLKPGSFFMLYSKSYWMHQEMSEARLEMDVRIKILEGLIPVYNAGFKVTDKSFKGNSGKNIGLQFRMERQDFLDVMEISGQNDSVDIYKLKEASLFKDPGGIFKNAMCPQVFLLMQTKTIRINRKRNLKLLHEALTEVGAMMLRIMKIASALTEGGYDFKIYERPDLDRNGEFFKDYMEAFRIVHMVVRISKILAFGRTGGENTRSETDHMPIDYEASKVLSQKYELDGALMVNIFNATSLKSTK